MPFDVAVIVAAILESYALAGLVFALVFLPRAALRVDPHLAGAPWTVRLLILPGVVALWPVLARRWATGATAPVERTPHRR